MGIKTKMAFVNVAYTVGSVWLCGIFGLYAAYHFIKNTNTLADNGFEDVWAITSMAFKESGSKLGISILCSLAFGIICGMFL